MVDQDMQASLAVTCYRAGEMGPNIRQCGGAGPTLSMEARLFEGAGPQTVLSNSACGEDGQHSILSLSFVSLSQMRAGSFATTNIQ